MTEKSYNIFEAATQLVSLDCSSITGQTTSICHHTSQSLHQSILNLKTVLPTFTSQFILFKEQIIQMSYFMANQLVSVIKVKSHTISELQKDLQKSQNLNSDMKKQVIQLQQMIVEFMNSYKKQMQQKQKEINQKQKQVDELKNVLKQNFNSPRNLCINCEQKISHTDIQILITEKIEKAKDPGQYDFKSNNLIKNHVKNEEILIEMGESIVCNIQETNSRKSLEIIQEENSQVNSLTDYLQSQRYSQKENTSQSISQMIKSTRSGGEKEKESFCTGKISIFDGKNIDCDKNQSQHLLSDNDKTVKDHHSPAGKINYFQSLEAKNFNDTFSSRITNKNYVNQNTKLENQRQRRNSETILAQKSIYEGFRIERKPQERTVLGNKMLDNRILSLHEEVKQQINLKTQLEQISKSSSCSEINYLGDSQKIHVNLPKKFESPKNMNFLKKISSIKDQRLRTQPSPSNSKYQIEKQNILIEYQPKPNEIGRKIMARKKMIMTHAKASTSRIETKKPLKQQAAEMICQPKQQDFSKKKENLIKIKFIESPQKQTSKSSQLLQPAIVTIFQPKRSYEMVPRSNIYMEHSTASNISVINQSAVKSHHMYHSTDKYYSAETPQNRHKITMTPGKPQSKHTEQKSVSKSKEKLKIMSKSVNQDQSIRCGKQQPKDRFFAEMNHISLSSSNNQSISKLKNKNVSVHIGSNTSNKLHLKQNLSEIKNALKNYSLHKILFSLREVYFDGKLVNDLKQGHGKIVYENGIIYEGALKAGKKEGESKLSLNGIEIFEGNFSNNQIEGQGYLKFFKYFTNSSYSCPKVLQNASYYGRFCESVFDGMGTLFLNQKEKIVSKFVKGVPFGELTFYTQNDIEFWHWPTD